MQGGSVRVGQTSRTDVWAWLGWADFRGAFGMVTFIHEI